MPSDSFPKLAALVTGGSPKTTPTILKALGLDPGALDSVKAEGTKALPNVGAQLGN